jgi:hypothetical protein
MDRLDLSGGIEDRGQAPQVLVDLGSCAVRVDQLGSVCAIQDHAPIGRDQARDARVSTRGAAAVRAVRRAFRL